MGWYGSNFFPAAVALNICVIEIRIVWAFVHVSERACVRAFVRKREY